MTLPYKRAEEFSARYLESVIYHDGVPVYVSRVSPQEGGEGSVTLSCYPIPTTAAKAFVVRGDYVGLTDNPMNLGYMNDTRDFNGKRVAVYCSRMPVRRSKQGLDVSNVYFRPVEGQQIMNFSSAMVMKSFADMMMNRYPEWGDVLRKISKRGDTTMEAFHKDFALEMTPLDLFVLNYKGNQIASSHDGAVFKLSQRSSHLKEVLTEKGVRIAV